MKKEFLSIIFLLSFISISNCGFSQTSISGVINKYTTVDSIYAGKDTIEVADPSDFGPNDTVMVYQVKGAEPKTDVSTQPYNFGNVRNNGLNMAGKYEIIIIQNIIGNKIAFQSSLYNNYNTDDFVQLIKVPSYKSASVDGELTCATWNGATGGVLALMVSDTLFLDANMNVSGKGFRGAQPFQSNGDCASVDSAVYGSQYFKESRDTISAGYKGEGIAAFDTTYRKGLGRWANGGEGGNARFSAGAGGGNRGNGGYGGEEDETVCITPAYETNPDYFFSGDPQWKSLGGSDGFGLGVQGFIDDSTIFLGGGGGAGTYTTGMIATEGGNGGGIVIIMAKVLKSNGNSIIADGESVTDIAEASGGGGGAGGTVVFDVDTVIGSTTVSVEGGDGGRVQVKAKSGPGGGGGGGAVLWNSTQPDNVTLLSAGGFFGYSVDVYPGEVYNHKATSGELGGTADVNIKVPLTGFLFNNISFDQEVCMNEVPDLITGTKPRGGYGTYIYQWQYKKKGGTWVDTAVTTRDLQPVALTDTTYYQRIVRSGNGVDTITDKGNLITVIVQDYIVNNQIFGDDLVTCIGNEADTITGTTVVLGGDTVSYNYIWEFRLDHDNDWNTLIALDSVTCLPGTVQDTTFVRRIVQSGACYDTTSNIQIIGLPQISNNVLSSDQEICYGQIPDAITGSVHGGGLGLGNDSIYWQKKTDASAWVTIADSSRKDFAPSNLVETTYYRRVILSDDCEDFSNTIKINVLPLIIKDSITSEPVIYTCYGTAPQKIIGSEPEGGAGAGSYTYQWQESSDGITWTDISSNATSKDYQAGALTDTVNFRRKVFSGLNDCCSSISDTVRANIYVLPVVTIKDIEDTICSGGDVTLNINISDGKAPYTIKYNDGFSDFTSNPVNNTQYNPVVNPQTTQESEIYDYTIVSATDDNSCAATDINGLTKIHVYGNPVANAGVDDENCELSYQLAAAPTLGTGAWTQVKGSGQTSFDDPSSSTTNFTVSSADTYQYKWKETNWQCVDEDTVEMILYQRPYNIFVSPQDTMLFFIDEVNLEGTYLNPDQFKATSQWEVVSGNGDFSPSASDSVVTLSNLNDLGQDSMIVTWTVSKRQCKDSVVYVSIKLQEIYTPTGFTPNGDGVNDYLKFNGIENSDEYNLIIFNRWGTTVYSENNKSEIKGWDGKKDGKDLPEDTYYYILKVTDDNATQTHKGYIVLKRY